MPVVSAVQTRISTIKLIHLALQERSSPTIEEVVETQDEDDDQNCYADLPPSDDGFPYEQPSKTTFQSPALHTNTRIKGDSSTWLAQLKFCIHLSPSHCCINHRRPFTATSIPSYSTSFPPSSPFIFLCQSETTCLPLRHLRRPAMLVHLRQG
ncbi:hypothetical protein NMY22_g14722 [Coprinellus aureogranulatus]|nr:hypothetical protein NMY22_g14722 [Coprinellus aureogranulatus]